MYDTEQKLIDRRELLRIKVKSYVAEAQIIRTEASAARAKRRFEMANEMTNHRKIAVRGAARHAGLALGFIKGRTLDQMESPRIDKDGKLIPRREIHWKSVRDMIQRYGTPLMHAPLLKAGIDVTKLEAELNAFNAARQQEWALERKAKEQARKVKEQEVVPAK